MSIIGWIVLGLLAGVIAKRLVPGNESVGVIVTMLLGIGARCSEASSQRPWASVIRSTSSSTSARGSLRSSGHGDPLRLERASRTAARLTQRTGPNEHLSAPSMLSLSLSPNARSSSRTREFGCRRASDRRARRVRRPGSGRNPGGCLREPRILADLGDVSFLDSTALGVLVRAVRKFDENGSRVRIVLPTGSARRIFEITTLDRVLPVAATRSEALAELAIGS